MTGNDQCVNMGKKYLVKNLEPWRLKVTGDEQPVLAIELFYKAHLLAVHQIFSDHSNAIALQQLAPMQSVNCMLHG